LSLIACGKAEDEVSVFRARRGDERSLSLSLQLVGHLDLTVRGGTAGECPADDVQARLDFSLPLR